MISSHSLMTINSNIYQQKILICCKMYNTFFFVNKGILGNKLNVHVNEKRKRSYRKMALS